MWRKSLGKTNIKQCTLTRRFELDFGTGTEESAVGFTSTLNQRGSTKISSYVPTAHHITTPSPSLSSRRALRLGFVTTGI
jgi:hypothetical protein